VATLSVRQLLTQVHDGQVRVPAFQRGFVWEMDRVAYFMDSLYKGYPFGSLLLWRTRNKLTHERKLGPYVLPKHDDDFPIDYVLDGQQRITSIFAVFQTEMKASEGVPRHSQRSFNAVKVDRGDSCRPSVGDAQDT
jgi:uncharacterized protein with ParB-like and HNH nuclease domain